MKQLNMHVKRQRSKEKGLEPSTNKHSNLSKEEKIKEIDT
jgi:hypothetical protein